MITNKTFTAAFAICFLLYLLPELFANNAMLYITGGIFGGTISQMLKFIINAPSSNLSFLIWGIVLILVVVLFFKTSNKLIKYPLLFFIGLLLYLIDFGFDSIVSYDPSIQNRIILSSGIKATCFLLFSVAVKSLFLSWIYYKGSKAEAVRKVFF